CFLHFDHHLLLLTFFFSQSYVYNLDLHSFPTRRSSDLKHNMPLGQPGLLSDQEAWDIAQFMNSNERPQDPRFIDDVETTRKTFEKFHQHTMYGQKVNGKVLGDHNNTGEKRFLKSDVLRPRTFE